MTKRKRGPSTRSSNVKVTRRKYAKSFFDLPFAIRREIYLFSGIPSGQKIDLNRPAYWLECRVLQPRVAVNEALRKRMDSRLRFRRAKTSDLMFRRKVGCDCFMCCFPTQFLLVSKAMHRDVISIIYGENDFLSERTFLSQFKRLMSLRADSIFHLKTLSLTIDSLDLKEDVSDSARADEIQDATEALEEFDILISWLAGHIQPGELRLTIVLEERCRAMRESCVKSLHRLPHLKDCAIRFMLHYTEKETVPSTRLARAAVQRLVASPGPQMISRFTEFPLEIKRLIVEKTFSNLRTTYHWSTTSSTFRGDRCCEKCTPAEFTCCCNFREAGYSSMCSCPDVPHELFLVSKEVRHIALETFLSSHRWVIDGDWITYPYKGGSVAQFFLATPKTFLPYLRHLHFEFPLVSRHNLAKEDFIWKGYYMTELCETVDYIWKYCDVQKLTITLDMTALLQNSCTYENWADGFVRNDDEEISTLHSCMSWVNVIEARIAENVQLEQKEAYKSTNMPRDFFVHLSYPVHIVMQKQRREIEQTLEQWVMGPNYDSEALSGIRRKPQFPQYESWEGMCEVLAQVLHQTLISRTNKRLCQEDIDDAYERHLEKSIDCNMKGPFGPWHRSGKGCWGPWYCMAPEAEWVTMDSRREWWNAENLWRIPSATDPDQGWPQWMMINRKPL